MKKTQKRKKTLRPLPWWQVVGWVLVYYVYMLVVLAVLALSPLALSALFFWLLRM